MMGGRMPFRGGMGGGFGGGGGGGGGGNFGRFGNQRGGFRDGGRGTL